MSLAPPAPDNRVNGMTSAESQIVNYLIRMVVPLRREFRRSLDVDLFMRDRSYAEQILSEASSSQDARLREFASYVAARLPGPRAVSAPTQRQHLPAATPAPPAHARVAPPAAPIVEAAELSEEDAMLDRMKRKYTQGLR
jgi:hypothetical protein